MKTSTLIAVALVGFGGCVSAEWPTEGSCDVIPSNDITEQPWETFLTDELPLGIEEGDTFSGLDMFANPLIATEALAESEMTYDVNEVCPEGKPCPCVKCVKTSGKKVLCYISKKIKAYCEKTKCPRIKKYCKILEEHKDFATGFIIEKVRPFLLGAAYCCGHGECRHPHVSNITDLITNSEDIPDGILQQLSEIIANSDSTLVKAAQSATMPVVQDGDRDKKCTDCLQHSVAFILHHLWEEIKKYCDKAKDPHAKKYCEWINKHKGVTTGYLYGAIEPWKYALGYCVGNKSCKSYHPHSEGGDQEAEILSFYEGKSALRINSVTNVV